MVAGFWFQPVSVPDFHGQKTNKQKQKKPETVEGDSDITAASYVPRLSKNQ